MFQRLFTSVSRTALKDARTYALYTTPKLPVPNFSSRVYWLAGSPEGFMGDIGIATGFGEVLGLGEETREGVAVDGEVGGFDAELFRRGCTIPKSQSRRC